MPSASQPLASRWIARYGWPIVKNIVGWTLLLASFVIGPFIPGPGGIPMFLIGFAMVTLPGKRAATARVLRGRPFQFVTLRVILFTLVFAVAAPGLGLLVLNERWDWLSSAYQRGPWVVLEVYSLGMLIAWIVAIAALLLSNVLVGFLPRLRRRVRPWLRDHHIRLLPPRRRQRPAHDCSGVPSPHVTDEIIAFLKRPRRPKAPSPNG